MSTLPLVRSGKPLAIVGTLVLLLAGGWFLLTQTLSEPQHHFKRHSLPYFLLLDSEIAKLPYLTTHPDSYFTSIAQDGTAPGVDAVSIATPDFEGAKQAISSHFINLGYIAKTQCQPACTVVWVKGEATISIYPEQGRLTVLKTKLTAN